MRYNPGIRYIVVLLASAWMGHCVADGNRISPTIANGSVVSNDTYPFMAAIQFSDAESVENPYGHHCGGTLISQRAVITAAHCVSQKSKDGALTVEPPSLFNIIVGMRNYGSGQGISRSVKEIKVHPKYARAKNPAFAYDVAILTLAEPIMDVLPVQLGKMSPSKEGLSATVLGWGTTSRSSAEMSETLLEGQVQTIQPSQCARKVRQGSQGTLSFNPSIQICTAANSGPCKGDSGGPLLESRNGQFVETGYRLRMGNYIQI